MIQTAPLIRSFPDPALREKAFTVERFDRDLLELVQMMEAVVAGANAVGLAANQLGYLRRVAVIAPEGMERLVTVNPVIEARSEESEEGFEACLSLPGIAGPVERAGAVEISYQDPRGRSQRRYLEGRAARVAQHEIDHLDGILISDSGRFAPLFLDVPVV